MSSYTAGLAEAFSSHRFRDTYDSLASDVEWVSIGGSTARGKEAVIAVCENTLAELADTTNEFIRFRSVADDHTAAVDVVGRYKATDGGTSVVASCDIFEFGDGRIARITSYAVDLVPGHGGQPTNG